MGTSLVLVAVVVVALVLAATLGPYVAQALTLPVLR
jgi:hypothetical protein